VIQQHAARLTRAALRSWAAGDLDTGADGEPDNEANGEVATPA